jgi:hypothetical protein
MKKGMVATATCPFSHLAVNYKSCPNAGHSGLAFIQAAFIVPLRACTFAVGFKLEHALAAFQFYVGCISIAFFEFFFRQYLRETAPALGAGRFDLVAFMAHVLPPDGLKFWKIALSWICQSNISAIG